MRFVYQLSLKASNLEGWSLVHYHKYMKTPTTLTLPVEEDFIGLYFNLGKAHGYSIEGFGSGTMHRKRYNMLYIPKGSCQLMLPKGDYSVFCILFTPTFLREFVSGFIAVDKAGNEFMNCFESAIPASLSDFNSIATAEMLEMIRETMENTREFTGTLREMFLEARMQGILTECVMHIQDQAGAYFLKSERVKLNKTYKYLLKNINRHYLTIHWLAKTMEIEEDQFEERFELLYRQTIFEVLQSQRMKKATLLLRDTYLPEKEIAQALGYRRTGDFLLAFENHYGYPTGLLRMTT